jgi:hypothetical protein
MNYDSKQRIGKEYYTHPTIYNYWQLSNINPIYEKLSYIEKEAVEKKLFSIYNRMLAKNLQQPHYVL